MAGALSAWLDGMGGDHVVESDRSVDDGTSTVVDLHEHPQFRQFVPDPGDTIAQRRVEHEYLGLAVVEEILQLLVDVAVVDVHRDRAALERPVLGHEVLGAVVEVQCHLAIGWNAGPLEGRSKAGRCLVELPIGHPASALHDGVAVRQVVGYRFPHARELELHAG